MPSRRVVSIGALRNLSESAKVSLGSHAGAVRRRNLRVHRCNMSSDC
jgi:hypothetical protein